MIEPEYFERKRRALGFERMDQLAVVQRWLNERYPPMDAPNPLARAKMIHRGVVRVVAANAALANDLRLRQLELLSDCGLQDQRLVITIGDTAPAPDYSAK